MIKLPNAFCKKSLPLVFAAILLASLLLAACSEKTPANNSGGTNADTETQSADTEPAETRLEPKLPSGARWDGYEFTVLTKGAYSSHWVSVDIAADEITGEPINDAVYARNLAVSEKYGVTVIDFPSPTADFNGVASKTILAGDDAYDMLCFYDAPLINSGCLANLYDIPYMDLSAPYYDQNCAGTLTINGKLFAVTGDLLIMDNSATWCVQFNKQMAADLQLDSIYGDSLYGLVNGGRWTLDVFYESAKLAARDVDGDGVMHELKDIWGFQTEGFNTYAFLVGSGGMLAKVTNDAAGAGIELGLYGERTQNVLAKAAEAQNDKTVALSSGTPKGYSNVFEEVLDKNFKEGRVLYNVAGMNRVTLFRAMEVDFGVLPIPAYDENQASGYHNPVSMSSNFISVPKTAGDLERTGVVLEALSCESRYTLIPAYYDITLKTKASRDNESHDMLDLIFATTHFDAGYYYDWGGLMGFVTGLTDAGTISSRLAAIEKSAAASFEKTLAAIADQ